MQSYANSAKCLVDLQIQAMIQSRRVAARAKQEGRIACVPGQDTDLDSADSGGILADALTTSCDGT